MKHKKIWKKVLIPLITVAVVGGGLGTWYLLSRRNAEPVNAYPFYYIGMTEYWGDSQESYGPVTTDRIQTVYLSDTQTVTEVMVAEGDTVKKGDLLMTFDTTLSDLALERERLNVEKLKLQLQDAQKQLAQINAMKPMVIPTVSEEEPDENLGTALKGAYQLSSRSEYDGSTPEKALICWIGSETAIDDSLFEAVRQRAEEYQEKNAELAPVEPAAVQAAAYAVTFLSNTEENDNPATEAPAEAPGEVPTEVPTEAPAETPTEAPDVTEPGVPSEPEIPTEPDVDLTVNSCYVIFKTTYKDMSLGSTQVWQGVRIFRDNGAFTFKFFDASGISDHMQAQLGESSTQTPEIDFGSGYTAAQIAQLRSEQEKTIKDLKFQVRMAEADYKIKQTEVSDGKLYAEIDGQVVSLLTEDEARMNGQPMMKVSGGGGFYVQGSVSELEKDNIRIGQEVTVNDWNTGMNHVGIIQSVGDFPSSDGYWNGMGNPNASYYPFTVFIDGSADLQEGTYVSVMYSSASAERGIYLENPFLRTEGGRSYVYVLGENGRLEQRFVTVGKSLWGSYTEILAGLSEEDFVAFPYGKEVYDGAPAEQCEDMSELYS